MLHFLHFPSVTGDLCTLLYESYEMQISDAFGSHFCVWRQGVNNYYAKGPMGSTAPQDQHG